MTTCWQSEQSGTYQIQDKEMRLGNLYCGSLRSANLSTVYEDNPKEITTTDCLKAG
jgi:hypothetical protein